MKVLDGLLLTLDRIAMHRLTAVLLGVTWVVTILLSGLGLLSWSAAGVAATGIVALGAGLLAGAVVKLITGRRDHLHSTIITALIVALIVWPGTAWADLLVTAAVVVVAVVSKNLIRVRGAVLFNPAAFALVVVAVAGYATEMWWVASTWLAPVLVLALVLIARRVRAVGPVLAFLALYVALYLWGSVLTSGWSGAVITGALWQSPALFLAAFMLTEPITQPPRRHQRIVVASVVAIIASAPVLLGGFGIHVGGGSFTLTPALGILAGNLVSHIWGRRGGTGFVVEEVSLAANAKGGSSGVHRVVVRPDRPVRINPGQWVELDLETVRDARGRRRVLTPIIHPDRDLLTLGVRADQPISAFKQTLTGQARARGRITRVGGDFIIPRDEPVVMVAVGVGITPFVAQLKDGVHPDSILIALVRPGEALPFVRELQASGVRGFAISRDGHTEVGERWQVHGGALDRDFLDAHVPDLADRSVYLAGAPSSVLPLRRLLRGAGARRVVVDEFSGY